LKLIVLFCRLLLMKMIVMSNDDDYTATRHCLSFLDDVHHRFILIIATRLYRYDVKVPNRNMKGQKI